MNMLMKLVEAEATLPQMLRDGQPWESLYIDYAQPIVERLWRQWGEYRICLHVIHAVKYGMSPLFHPHPWPSAIRVHDRYRMYQGFGPPDSPEPDVTQIINLGPGSQYTIENPNIWHAVDVPEGLSRSVMVIGPPFPELADLAAQKQSPLKARPTLEPQNRELNLECFRVLYPESKSSMRGSGDDDACSLGYCHHEEH